MKKISFVLAIILCLGSLLTSCSPDTPPLTSTVSTPTTPPQTPLSTPSGPAQTTAPDPGVVSPPPSISDAFEFTNVSVITPNGASELILAASESLNGAYNRLTDKNLPLADDLTQAQAGEILIGQTNRPTTDSAKNLLPANERFAYVIARVEDSIVIVGTTDEMTLMGIDYFANSLLAEKISADGKLNIEKDFVYIKTAASVSLETSSGYRFVVARAVKDITMEVGESVGEMLKTLTGKFYRVTMDSKGKDSERNQNPEILVGATYYPESLQVMTKFAYDEYGIAVIGQKLIVFGYSAKTLGLAKTLLQTVAQKNLYDGTLILPEGMFIKCSADDSASRFPIYPSDLQSAIGAGEGGTLIRAYETTPEAFKAYGQALASDGFTLLSEHTAGENIFFTYCKDKLTLTCNYHPANKTADIIMDDEKNRPTSAVENQYTPITTTLFTQMGLNYIAANAGMGYVMRLADGRFIVIDGGVNEYDEYKKLYEIILTQHQESGREGKPVIAAWLLTHAHGDHYGNFQKFAQVYCPNDVTLESVVWNMGTSVSNPSLQSLAGSVRNFFKNNLPDTHIYYARTGQRYHLANVTVDILFTPDDYGFSAPGGSDNNSSVYYKITETVSGQTIMITGDSEAPAAGYMVNRYSAGGLESDIMQQAHHGYWAGSVELYKLINPEIVFWPCPSRWYYALYNGSYDSTSNKWIAIESTKVKQIILAGNGTYTVTLPHTAVESKPHTTSIKYDDGAVIFHQDFENCQLYNTGIGAVDTNGNDPGSNYTSMNFSLVDYNGQRALYWKGTSYSVMRIATPDMVRGNDIVTLTLDIDITDSGSGFSLWFNDKTIQNINNRTLYTLPKSKNGSMELALEINRTTQTYIIYINGSLYARGTSESNDAGFIALLSQGATVYIDEITLTAGTYAQKNP